MTAVAATARRSGRQLHAGLGAQEYNKKKKRSALNDGSGKQKLTAVPTTARRSGRQLQAGLGAEEYNNNKKRSALNDGSGKQKLMRPALSDHRMTRCASKQQQRIQEFPGFDVGDVPLDVNDSFPLSFHSHWTENSPDPAPKEYEDMAKIGLETYNRLNDTLYRFTKILRVNSLSKGAYIAYHITFQAKDESSFKNFETKAASIRDITVVPFCKLEKGLDVAAPEGDSKQTETLSDLAVSAFVENQKERQQLLREETRRIEERRGFDFGDIPPLVPFPDVAPNQIFEPCWSESSRNPAPKLYEDVSKMAIKNYNCENHTSYQFTKILEVYFYKHGKTISRYIYFQVEDTSVASPRKFKAQLEFHPSRAMVCSCRPKVESIDLSTIHGINTMFGWFRNPTRSYWYWSSPDQWVF